MDPLPSYSEICDLEPKDLAQVLLTGSLTLSAFSINEFLENGVALEALTPHVFSVWLTVCADVEIIRLALHSQISIAVRTYAVRQFAHGLRTDRADDLWTQVGGVAGLIEWCSAASVREVQYLCRVFGRIGSSHKSVSKTQPRITDLLRSLAHHYFQDAPEANPDDRNLLVHYSLLLPACTPECVEQWLDNKALPKPRMKKVIVAHPQLFQRRTIAALTDDTSPGLLTSEQAVLFTSAPALPSDVPHLSAPALFSVEILEALTSRSPLSKQEQEQGEQQTELKYHRLAVQSLSESLLRRLYRARHKVSKSAVLRVFRAVANYCHIQTESIDPLPISYEQETAASHMTRLWSVYSTELTDDFSLFLASYPSRDSGYLHFEKDHLVHFLTRVPRPKRLDLLKVLLKVLPEYDFDIDGDHRASSHKKPMVWDELLFLILPEKDALIVLQKLTDRKLIKSFDTRDMYRHTPLFGLESDNYHVERLKVRLSRGQPGALETAELFIGKARQAAEKCREPATRANAVTLVLSLAVAAGSYSLLRRILVWLQRFTKDHHTLMAVYSCYMFENPELQILLIGMPSLQALQHTSLSRINARVKKSNNLILLLLDNALLSLREPNFDARVWSEVTVILTDVVLSRSRQLISLRKHSRMTDDEVYKCIWEDTLDTWIKFETLLLLEHNKPINQYSVGGPLKNRYEPSVSSFDYDTTVMMFLDRLAEARDDLWRDVRRRSHPSLLDLPSIWPSGLPVQYLVPKSLVWSHKVLKKIDNARHKVYTWRRKVDRKPGKSLEDSANGLSHMPFVMSRVKDILFRSQADVQQAVVPTDKPFTKTIGPFVDSYEYALNLWLSAVPNGEQRNARLYKAWTHAVMNFSNPKLSEKEAQEFWVTRYTDMLGSIPDELQNLVQQPRIVVLPKEGQTNILEYNPQPDLGSEDPESHAPPFVDALLDIVVDPHGSIDDEPTFSKKPQSQRRNPLFGHDPFKNDVRNHEIPKQREAYIASALLLIEAKYCPGHKLLARPFPSSANPRFPAVFLDQSFLTDLPQRTDIALDVLAHFKKHLPPSLLDQLIHRLQDAQKDDLLKTTLHTFEFRLLRLLLSGDRPMAAATLILDLVVKRPHESSWHRQILTRGFLNSLSYSDLKTFLSELGNNIISKLDQHDRQKENAPEHQLHNDASEEANASEEYEANKEVHVSEEDDASKVDSPLPESTVKVSTVKLFADILNDAAYINQHQALLLLSSLFQKATHLDSRAVILNSVIDHMLNLDETNLHLAEAEQYIENTLQAAARYAASLDERHPLSEAQWRTAEDSGTVPSVAIYNTETGYQAPIWYLLVSAISSLVKKNQPDKAQAYVRDIIVPMLEMSRRNHERWLRLFLRSQGLDSAQASSLPSVIPEPARLIPLLKNHAGLLPTAYLTMHAQYTNTLLAPSPLINKVNEAISKDGAIETAGRSHWESLWSVKPAYGLPNFAVASLLDGRFGALDSGMVTLQQTQDVCTTQIELMAARGRECEDILEQQLQALEPNKYPLDELYHEWAERSKPVLVEVLKRIEARRTEAWQTDPNRSPDVLPNLLQYRLYLLPWPAHARAVGRSADEQLDAFEAAVDLHIEQILQDDTPYHVNKANDLITNAVTNDVHTEHNLAIVLRFGALADPLAVKQSAHTWLRLEIAESLLRAVVNDLMMRRGPVKKCSREETDALKLMLQQWRDSPVEGIRRMGVKAWDTAEQLLAHDE